MIKHQKVSGIADGADTSLVRPSDWNKAHTSVFGLDRLAFNATYGDDFDEASLNARWARHVQTSGEESYQQGGNASALKVDFSTGAAARYIYQTAPNGTNETWEWSYSAYQETTTGQMFSLLMVDGSGNGVAAMLYDATVGLYLVNVANHIYTSVLTQNGNLRVPIGYQQAGGRIWLKLRKATGLYAASYSIDGETYAREATGTPTGFTPTRVGVGRILGTTANDIVFNHWFDKTA